MEKPSDKLSDLLVRRLQTLIRERSLTAGMRLPSERKLAAELQVSRASVREALQKLNSTGVVTTHRGGGTYVCKALSPWSQRVIVEPLLAQMDNPGYRSDILEARHTLEAGTAWHAALRATAEDKHRLQYCFDAMCVLQAGGDAGLVAQADARVHLMIAEACTHSVVLQA